ncbi:spore coat protein YsxE [Oceanobacillus massiliensis]|uniref:spore coat protein YsxE n=1 Tax=Oceanobacillus massiliensis TaxID=1465765 RepID=UPI0002894330|nr:spore coat protein YsxE [Oceanobacillus massiliensis]
MDMLKKVLQSYRIYPIDTEQITDRLFRINDGKRDYALKRSSLTEETVAAWQNVYHMANEKNISEIVPVYLTKEGKLYEQTNNGIFYLTPWVEHSDENKERNSISITLDSLARLHEKTKKSHRISRDTLKENFDTYLAFCKRLPGELRGYVIQFEKKTYMSPFELQVCTHFRVMEYAFQLINTRISEFLDQSEEEFIWNHSLCHGNLRTDHMLNGYMINWEKAGYNHAAADLADYFSRLTGNYDQPADQINEAFRKYKKINDLSEAELKLLSIYLLNPSHYITIIRDYKEKPSDKPMADQVKDLQRQYRNLLFAVKWTEFIKDEYEGITFEDTEL